MTGAAPPTSITVARGAELRRLLEASALLQVVNVWDVASAKVVAALPGTTAIATASHSIAATFGYPDGEAIPASLMLDMCGRIARAVDLPVSADLEAGYGAPGETVRRAIGEGLVGANLEDQMKPLPEAVAAVRDAVAAADAEGVPFALNARTDAFLRAGDRPLGETIAAAIERGRAYLDAGATCVFVPGNFGEAVVAELVAGIGERRVSVIGLSELPPPARLEALGVARVSYGPNTQRVALGALEDLANTLIAGGTLPSGIRPLN
ncbi:isocitrate lyase/PEP mutase family protein [Agromyces aerolatus]|uniref:isocitrate lyase/PEP mutase family protein n=1 Tax=Agromyces sp. LY-1074 TaxID=3074080 RepID=UPI00285C4E7B|nr:MULTISPECIES: isocitrate lyase/phosphoenolpyruvate mutase family protein [unclassified Agromyces]MDR5701528.1 isocitrate lyase/phosphoenolpyruvate mutase family protein [Agromyces sp. LY-1074]MDR5707865.1 isocitrate lyase/phosphoenolpyruvate mutase family protein [Agromyces sp. LY-1358]